jgi:hypothetical protein
MLVAGVLKFLIHLDCCDRYLATHKLGIKGKTSERLKLWVLDKHSCLQKWVYKMEIFLSRLNVNNRVCTKSYGLFSQKTFSLIKMTDDAINPRRLR